MHIYQFTAPPVISATISTYASKTGSNVTLSCNISDKGTPEALFTWRKSGQDLSDGEIASVNETVMTLTLVNVTMESAGVYTCAATSALSYRSDVVVLLVEGKILCFIYSYSIHTILHYVQTFCL